MSDVSTDQPNEITVSIQNALKDESIAHHYINGFYAGTSGSDVFVLGQMNGRIALSINMSFTTAKTLAMHLREALKSLEEQTGKEIMTMEYIQEAKEQ